jgi:hypothetical protein
MAFPTPIDLAVLAEADDMSLETYHALCQKYAAPYHTFSEADAGLPPSEMKAIIHRFLRESSSMVLQVRGAIDSETMDEKLDALFQTIDLVLAAEKKTVVVFTSSKPAKYPHPKTLRALEEGTLSLAAEGLVTPPHFRPAATLVLNHGGSHFLCVNGGLTSNMRFYKTKWTLGSMGCSKALIPAHLLQVRILSKEHTIHLVKAVAVAIFQKMRCPGTTEEEATLPLEKLQEVEDCKEAKDIGRSIKIVEGYFALCPDNSALASALANFLEIAEGGSSLAKLISYTDEKKIRIVESAMHKPKGSFQGHMRELGWGSTGGGLQSCINPFGLTSIKDKKPPAGIFAKGIALVGGAMAGSGWALEALGLHAAPQKQEDFAPAAARVMEKIFGNIQKAAEQL